MDGLFNRVGEWVNVAYTNVKGFINDKKMEKEANNQNKLVTTSGNEIKKNENKVVKKSASQEQNSNNENYENTEINETQARKIARAKFEELGEKVSDENDFEVIGILRGGEKYYIVSAVDNTLEIKIMGGVITKVNGVNI